MKIKKKCINYQNEQRKQYFNSKKKISFIYLKTIQSQKIKVKNMIILKLGYFLIELKEKLPATNLSY